MEMKKRNLKRYSVMRISLMLVSPVARCVFYKLYTEAHVNTYRLTINNFNLLMSDSTYDRKSFEKITVIQR